MRCYKHETDAVAVCVNCGRAMCEACILDNTRDRFVCSEKCLDQASGDREALALLKNKVKSGYTAVAWFAAVLGLVFLGMSYSEMFLEQNTSYPLFFFGFSMGIVFLVTGFVYHRLAKAKKKAQHEK